MRVLEVGTQYIDEIRLKPLLNNIEELVLWVPHYLIDVMVDNVRFELDNIEVKIKDFQISVRKIDETSLIRA